MSLDLATSPTLLALSGRGGAARSTASGDSTPAAWHDGALGSPAGLSPGAAGLSSGLADDPFAALATRHGGSAV